MSAFPDKLSNNGGARANAGVLYRVDSAVNGDVVLLVQSVLAPDWARLPPPWLSPTGRPEVKEIAEALGRIDTGSLLRFRLVANPTRKIDTKTGADGRKNNGRRVELRGEDEWVAWLERKGEDSGFRLRAVSAAPHVPDVRSGREPRATGRKNGPDGSSLRLTFGGVAFEGRLEVVDTARFHEGLRAGVGPGKAYGYGLLSVAPGG
jgi:CRISPR system Cascade subunit CasE